MPSKTTHVEGVGSVNIVRRQGVRSMRLNVDSKGVVRLTLPWWVSVRTGMDFARAKVIWINSQKEAVKFTPTSGMEFGKGLQLRVEYSKSHRFRKRLDANVLIVFIPVTASIFDDETTEYIIKSMTGALRYQAEEVLIPRMRALAFEHAFAYKSCSIKLLKSRWGSCSQAADIVINLYLIQLPWELVDYVLLHELNHTNHLYHGPVFWKGLEEVCPNAKMLRQKLHKYQPRLYDDIKSV